MSIDTRLVGIIVGACVAIGLYLMGYELFVDIVVFLFCMLVLFCALILINRCIDNLIKNNITGGGGDDYNKN